MPAPQPGDVVHAFGHSQGAAITGHLALEGGFDTRTLVSLGSPIEADVGPETLSVVAAPHRRPARDADRAAGTITRSAPRAASSPTGSPIRTPACRTCMLPAHDAAAYVETAGMLDASSDPRMDAVRELFDELGGAASVEVTEYGAERP